MSKQRATPASNPVTFPLVHGIVQPISEWCEAERGRKTDFVNAVKKAAAPETYTRNLVESWIRPDPEKRKVPQFGSGLLLLQVAINMGILPARLPFDVTPRTEPTNPLTGKVRTQKKKAAKAAKR